MEPSVIKPDITPLKEAWLDTIKAYCESQDWSRVAYWAIMADGVTGYSDNLSRAYSHGKWMLPVTSQGYYYFYVDLRTNQIKTTGLNRPVDLSDFPQLAGILIENLNVQNILADLKAKAHQTPSEFIRARTTRERIVLIEAYYG
jgi:hypothetical protein